MARTVPIPAGRPLDATWKAAGQVVTLAAAEAVAVQAAASVTLAALLWPLIPAARAAAGLAGALGQRLPLRPLPEQEASAPAEVVVVMPGSGGAGRGAAVPGGAPGAVRAAAAVTLGVEEEFVLLDPATGATVLAAPELVRMLGGEPGVQQELMRFQVETATGVCTSLDEAGRELTRLRRLAAAAAASLGCPAGGLRGRAVPHARAGRDDRPAPLPGAGPPVRPGGGRCGHLRLPRARRGPLPGGGRPGAGPAAALARAAARRHRQLPDRRRPRHRMGQLAACDPGTLADRDPARGLAGRGRLRHGNPPPHRARGGAGRAERLLPGPAFPALPHRRGPGRRRLPRHRHRGPRGGADPRPGRHRPGRGPPGDAGGSAAARQVAAALAAAARHGLAGAAADPVTGQAVDAAALRARLLEHVYPALRDHGDTETITGLLRRLDDRGTGADRQRALFTRAASTPAFITALARATLSGYQPGRQQPDARVRAAAMVHGRGFQDEADARPAQLAAASSRRPA